MIRPFLPIASVCLPAATDSRCREQRLTRCAVESSKCRPDDVPRQRYVSSGGVPEPSYLRRSQISAGRTKNFKFPRLWCARCRLGLRGSRHRVVARRSCPAETTGIIPGGRWRMSRATYHFGPFSIESEARVLIRDGKRVPVPPKAAGLQPARRHPPVLRPRHG